MCHWAFNCVQPVQSLTRSDCIEDFGIAVAVVGMARQQAAKQARGLAHPQLCLDAVQAGIERGGHAGLQTVRFAAWLMCSGASRLVGRAQLDAQQGCVRSCSHRPEPHATCHFRLQEAECFVRAASLPVHKALVWTFLGQRATQRVRSRVAPNSLGRQLHGFLMWNRQLLCSRSLQAMSANAYLCVPQTTKSS